jgi:hypothetical protein
MSKKDNPEYFLNTKTNRYFKKGSPTYNKMFANGYFNKCSETELEKPQIVEPIPELPVEPLKPTSQITSDLRTELKSIIKSNKNDFVGLSQKQTDELLKRMLYEKLCLNKKPKKEKDKNKRKSKKYKIQSSSSDSSSSESE